MRYINLLLIAILCGLNGLSLAQDSVTDESQTSEIFDQSNAEWDEYEQEEILAWGYYHNVDLYYTNAGVLYNLGEQSIPDVGLNSELQVYLDLFKRSGIPQYFLLEFSLYPMPITGVYLRENQEDFYDQLTIGENFNLIESITAGFEEPYALSVFFNNMVTYDSIGVKNSSNLGFMGYLFSVGNYHIQRNRLIKDNWLEIEWKIKGDFQQAAENLSWSFRLGGKIHQHSEIVDTFHLVLRRSRIASNKPLFSWLYNTSYEFTYTVTQNNLARVGIQVFVDKKIPVKISKTVLSLGIGIIYESNNKYSGNLREAQDENSDTFLVIRPSIEF